MPPEHRHSFQYDTDAKTAVIEAVAHVKGVNQADLEPLQHVVDTDAFDALLAPTDNTPVEITLQYERCQVIVDTNGNITVRTLSYLPNDIVKNAANILVLAPATSHVAAEICAELLTPTSNDSPNRLFVDFDNTTPTYEHYLETRPPHKSSPTTLVSVGEFARSTTPPSQTSPETPNENTVEFVPDPSNLAEFGGVLNRCLETPSDNDQRTAMCFDSLTHLLDEVTLQQAFKFLHVLSARINSIEGIAHYHLDPNQFTDETILTLQPVFDAVISIDDCGNIEVDSPHSAP